MLITCRCLGIENCDGPHNKGGPRRGPAVSGSFLITLREGLEAGLIVAIILAYLKASGQRPHFRTVLMAALAAVAVSLAVGAAIFAVAGEFEGRTAEAFEGTAMLLALALIPFTAILREGLETSVFLFAATRTSTPLESTIGASGGILAATALTWGLC